MKFKITLLSLVLLLILGGCSECEEVPSYLKDYKKEYCNNPKAANIKWFTDAKYGLFMHYGLYSILEKGEWVMLKDTIPVAEYSKLKDQFTAENFDVDMITDLVIDAGMKYITITSKHHDGFCLFETRATDYNILNSPAKRDIIKELYEACEQKGLGLFLYYSYGADWHHPYFFPLNGKWKGARPAYKEPQPEYKFEKDEDFKIYVEYVHEQLTEILTQYPNIAGIWFDPIRGYYNRPELFPMDSTYALIRKLSPHALISFKQGANGDEDFMAPEREGNKKVEQKNEVARKAYEKNQNKPREICNTLQKNEWGYNKSEDGKHKTADDIIQMLKDAEETGANLLLNVGPKPDGSFPQEDIDALKEAGEMLRKTDKKRRMEETTLYYYFSTIAQVLAAISALLAVFTQFKIRELIDFMVGDGISVYERLKVKEKNGYDVFDVDEQSKYCNRLRDAISRKSLKGIEEIIIKLADYDVDNNPRGLNFLKDRFNDRLERINKIKLFTRRSIIFSFLSIFISIISILFVSYFISFCLIYWLIVLIILVITFISMLYAINGVFLGLNNEKDV